MRLIIDVIACEANGACTRILPEALELDDEDQLHLRLAVIPPELEDKAERAVRVCPRQALRLEPSKP
ncbi:ferredoxin [Enhygromyxa salina]|uniref:Ferredoxin n=1 Tax=Enhygromyxa salina TaxID=215803 RepID=A0A2S9YA75_9BACT|nr:ferredoxin [Enhygromyxa salina]PRQ01999.1 hypothetical protein ENSA7_56670 [Enhygromyxa salina]